MTTYVIDSNCFIHMGSFAKDVIVRYILKSNLPLNVTSGVLDEVRTVKFQRIEKKPRLLEVIGEKLTVHSIDDAQIKALATKIGERAAPQDVDVSLLVLSYQLKQQGEEVLLVTDDFKLANAGTNHQLVSEVCPPSTFFERLYRLESGKIANDIKKLAWKIRSAEMQYAISRKEQYNIQEKLTWLIESLLDQEVQETETENQDVNIPQQSPSIRKLVQNLVKLSRGGKIKPSMNERIQHLLPICKHVTALLDSIDSLYKLDDRTNLDNKLENVQIETRNVYENVAYDLTSLKGDDLEIIQQYTFKALTKSYLLQGILFQNQGLADQSKTAFSKALFYTSLLDDDVNESKILISLATIHITKEDYGNGMLCIQKSINLGIENDAMSIQRHILVAICHEFMGKTNQALEAIRRAAITLKEHLQSGTEAIFGLGKSFLALNAPHIAVELFDEALECHAQLDSWSEEVFGLYMTALNRSEDISGKPSIRELLDQIHQQSDEVQTLIEEKIKENL